MIDVLVCPCGHRFQTNFVSPPPVHTNIGALLTCPCCGSERVQKVSGLAQAHTRYGASVNATNHYAGFLATGHSLGVGLKASTSVLAGALAPPVQPTIRNNDSGCGLYLVLFTSIMFALIGVLGFVGATKSNDGAMFGGIFSIAALAGFVVHHQGEPQLRQAQCEPIR